MYLQLLLLHGKDFHLLRTFSVVSVFPLSEWPGFGTLFCWDYIFNFGSLHVESGSFEPSS